MGNELESLLGLALLGTLGAGLTNLAGWTNINNPIIYIIPENAGIHMIRFTSHPVTKTGFWIYIGFVTLSFISSTWNDGKRGLREHRKIKTSDPDDDFDATWKGCRKNMWDNFFDGVFFPWTTLTNILPFMILKMNPRTDKKE